MGIPWGSSPAGDENHNADKNHANSILFAHPQSPPRFRGVFPLLFPCSSRCLLWAEYRKSLCPSRIPCLSSRTVTPSGDLVLGACGEKEKELLLNGKSAAAIASSTSSSQRGRHTDARKGATASSTLIFPSWLCDTAAKTRGREPRRPCGARDQSAKMQMQLLRHSRQKQGGVDPTKAQHQAAPARSLPLSGSSQC